VAEIILPLGAAYAISLGVVALAIFILVRKFLGLTTREAGAAIFTATCGNAIFLGIPIALAVPAWTPNFLILVLYEGTLCFALGTALMTWPEGDDAAGRSSWSTIFSNVRGALGRSLKNPIVVGTLAGVAAGALQLEPPAPLAAFLSFLGRVAGPIGLFILGLSTADLILQRRAGHGRAIAILMPFKLLIFPALTGNLTWLFTQDPATTATATLFTGLPPAVASIVLSTVYRQWISGVAAFVASTTVVGLLTLAGYLFVVLPR